MELILIIALVVLGAVSVFVGMRKIEKLIDSVHFILFAAVSILFLSGVESSYSFVFGLLAITSISLVVSHFSKLKDKWYSSLIVLLMTLVYFILFKDDTLKLYNEINVLNNKFAILGILFAGLSPVLLILKIKVLHKIFETNQDLSTPIYIFFVGISLFLLNLGIGQFGYLVGAAIFLSHSFFYSKHLKTIGVSIIMLSAASLILMHLRADLLITLTGDVIFGLFTGAFVALLIGEYKPEGIRQKLLLILGVILFLIVELVLLYSGSIFHLMGGVDAVVAMLFGLLITNLFVKNSIVIGGTMVLSLSTLFLLEPVFYHKDELQITSGEPDTEVVQLPMLKEIPLKGIGGLYEIIPDSSFVDFTLGANNETKGAFKKVSGEVLFNEDLTDVEFEVKLDLNDFTTFNSFRDESLMEEEYFDQVKFPKMTYKANKLVQNANGEFRLKGSFSMLGVSKPIEVSLKRIESQNGVRLIGEGTINRVEFGMTPSSSEGNFVSFKYDVLLKDQK